MSATATRYPVKVMSRARELRAMGWSYPMVADLVSSQFEVTPPTTMTVRKWVDPEYAEKRREIERTAHRKRRQAAGWRFTFSGQCSEEYRTEFMRELKGAGLTVNGIAKVYGVVFGEPIDSRAVRGRIGGEA